jgi:hypothetical protein
MRLWKWTENVIHCEGKHFIYSHNKHSLLPCLWHSKHLTQRSCKCGHNTKHYNIALLISTETLLDMQCLLQTQDVFAGYFSRCQPPKLSELTSWISALFVYPPVLQLLKKLPQILRNPMVLNRVHNNPQLVPILSQINPVLITPSHVS